MVLIKISSPANEEEERHQWGDICNLVFNPRCRYVLIHSVQVKGCPAWPCTEN